MKQRAIFSRHAWIMALSLRPARELRSAAGAQMVMSLEKMTHGEDEEAAAGVGAAERRADWGAMSGGGGTPRSGRVRVFARRRVGAGARRGAGAVVGMGTSAWSKRRAIGVERRVVASECRRRRRRPCERR
jgi:hypothetical protein